MNLNPYQNDLLSFYLEKSAARLDISGKPVRPRPKRTVNTNAPSGAIVPYRAPRRPSIGGPTAGRFYRELAGTRWINPKLVESILGNKAHLWDDGVYFNNTYYPGRTDIFPPPRRAKGRIIDTEAGGGAGGRGGNGGGRGPLLPNTEAGGSLGGRRPLLPNTEAGGGAGGNGGGRPPGNTPVPGTPEFPGNGSGRPTGNTSSSGVHELNGGGRGTAPTPDAKTGRPWYKNPWILGGGATTATVGGGAALYNYASNKAKETTDAAAPTPGGGSNNKNDSNNTPTPNESPESESWWDSILEWVQENPELAMLILAGGGFAGGALLAR